MHHPDTGFSFWTNIVPRALRAEGSEFLVCSVGLTSLGMERTVGLVRLVSM